MSKLEVVEVKVKGKDSRVEDFLYSVYGDPNHALLTSILELDVVYVESQIVDGRHVTIVNNEYQIITEKNKIFCLIKIENDDYIELKFNDKKFKIYRNFSYINITKSKTRDIFAEKIYLIRKEMAQIRKMIPELEREVAVEVRIKDKIKKINTLASEEEVQNIIDQIFVEEENVKQEIVEIRWDGEEVSLEEFLSKLDEKKASRIKELLNEDIVSISEGAHLPDYTIPLFIEVAESKRRQYVLMQAGASRGQIVLCFNNKYYTITDTMYVEKTALHLPTR